MLYWLLFEKLFPIFSPARVFGYVTFRTAFASLTALFLSIWLGPLLIRKLREFQIGQQIREEVTGHPARSGGQSATDAGRRGWRRLQFPTAHFRSRGGSRMFRTRFVLPLLAAGLLAVPARAADPTAAADPADLKKTLDKAYDFLKSKQEADGSYLKKFAGPGVSALVAAS